MSKVARVYGLPTLVILSRNTIAKNRSEAFAQSRERFLVCGRMFDRKNGKGGLKMTDEEHGQGENLVVVFKAPDESTANLVHGLLVGEGIPAVIESRQVAWMDGVMKLGEGYWGNIVVPKEDADRSREVIAAFHADVTDEDVTQE